MINALFSIAPLLIVVTGVAGLVLGRAAARGEVAPWLERAFSREGARSGRDHGAPKSPRLRAASSRRSPGS
ncbi:MAG: hypothetical protein ABR606_11060 [Vicinamibacterales bacterium]